MGGLRESWCFCKGVSKSERMKCAIFSGKCQAMATITSTTNNGVSGTGFLIHPNLLLTTHANLPSAVAATAAEIRLHNGVPATLVPQRFFITSSVLDLTIVGLDDADGESNVQGQNPQYLKTCCKTNLDLGSVVYLLGYTKKQELTVGEEKVVIATDNLIKLSTDGITWSPGSAGFDVYGNLAFMLCDPMKLASSPNTKSPSTSSSSSPSSSWKKDLPMQFGIPIPVICDWLNQHWEGNLDELNKPKLPLIRLRSTGPKSSEHSCASFSRRQVFKSTDADNNAGTSSSQNNDVIKTRHHAAVTTTSNTVEEESLITHPNVTTHIQGIPTPEIYESPRVTSVPLRRRENTPKQILDINFPPRIAKPAVLPQSSNEPHPMCAETLPENQQEGEQNQNRRPTTPIAEVSSTGSVNGAQNEVQSSSSPVMEPHDGYSSEGETMYSAETAESRNYTSPRETKFHQVGRSQSCVSYNRWGAAKRSQVARGMLVENQRSFMHVKKVYSQGATSQRSNDYFSPTVSSIMKRNGSEQPVPTRSRQTAFHSPSPRWMF